LNLNFDHSYCVDEKFKYWKRLEKLGFNLATYEVAHPDAKCRFIYFKDMQYLEFLSSSYSKPLPNQSGLSFSYSGELQTLQLKYQKVGLFPELTHRNYNWQENNKDYLPGWNFLTFNKVNFRTILVWFTHYEKSSSRKAKYVPHPNGVNRIIGHEFVINDKGRAFFSKILGCTIKDKIHLNENMTLYFKKGRTNRHEYVHLQADNSKKSNKYFKHYQKQEANGLNYYLVEQGERGVGIKIF
jgi:hypothetical protein